MQRDLRIYVTAVPEREADKRALCSILRHMGHAVSMAQTPNPQNGPMPALERVCAVTSADLVVCLSGDDMDFGMAVGASRPTVFVGELRHTLHRHPAVQRFTRIPEFVDALLTGKVRVPEPPLTSEEKADMDATLAKSDEAQPVAVAVQQPVAPANPVKAAPALLCSVCQTAKLSNGEVVHLN